VHDDLDLAGASAPSDDPFEDIPAEEPVAPGVVDLSAGPEEERLGGSDAPAPPDGEFLEEPQEPDDEAMEPPTTVDEEEPPPPEPVPEPEPEPAVDPEPEPTPEPPPPPPAAEAAAEEKKGSPVRRYYVLRASDSDESTFQVVDSVTAHNPDGAMRQGYRLLFGDEPGQEATLAVVPQSMWQPRKIKGRQPRTNLALDIGE
jgi:hypothetical protein